MLLDLWWQREMLSKKTQRRLAIPNTMTCIRQHIMRWSVLAALIRPGLVLEQGFHAACDKEGSSLRVLLLWARCMHWWEPIHAVRPSSRSLANVGSLGKCHLRSVAVRLYRFSACQHIFSSHHSSASPSRWVLHELVVSWPALRPLHSQPRET